MNERGQIRSKKMCASARVLKESLQVCCCFTFLRRLSITVRKTWDTIRPIPTASSRAEMTPTAGIRHDLRVMSAMQPLRLLWRMNGTSRSKAWVMLGKKVYGPPRSSHAFVGCWMQDSCNAQPFSARCCEAGSYRWEGVQTSERLSDEIVSRVPGLNCEGGGDQGSQLSRSSLFLSNQPPPKIQIARVFLELRQVPQNARSAAPIIHGCHYFVFHVNEKKMEIITIHLWRSCCLVINV